MLFTATALLHDPGYLADVVEEFHEHFAVSPLSQAHFVRRAGYVGEGRRMHGAVLIGKWMGPHLPPASEEGYLFE